jgi:MoxR-like ATPase
MTTTDDSATHIPDWRIFTGSLRPHNGIERLPEPPPWRPFRAEVVRERRLLSHGDDIPFDRTDRGRTFRATPEMVEMVNAALYLRRPLLVTGRPGTGKSSLLYAVAYELRLGRVLRWSITSRSTLKDALYKYAAIGRLQATQQRLQEAQLALSKGEIDAETTVASPIDIGEYLKLGPLGTALLPTSRPWPLLVDEIDKADIDLPNDLLNIFEEGEYEIPELKRLGIDTVEIRGHESDATFAITRGHVRCHQFPLVVLTSNGEREFPPPFLRRCLRLEMPEPDEDLLAEIVAAHLGSATATAEAPLIKEFFRRRTTAALATDQLLNAIHLVTSGHVQPSERERLIDSLFRELTTLSPP